eukprot:g6589.t1
MKALDSGNLAAFAVALLMPVNVAFEEKSKDVSKKTDSGEAASKKQTVFEDVEFYLIRFKTADLLKELAFLLLQLSVKAVLWYGLGVLSQSTTDFSFQQSFVYSFFFYFHLSTIGTATDLVVLATFNIKMSPAFDSPFLARSVTVFWSHKWNLVAQRILKDVFFDCVAEGTLVAGKQYRSKLRLSTGRVLCAMISVFTTSGLMHGLFIMKALNTTEFPVHLLLFLANAVVVIVEKLCRIVLKRMGFYTRSPSIFVAVLLVLYTQTTVHALSHLCSGLT